MSIEKTFDLAAANEMHFFPAAAICAIMALAEIQSPSLLVTRKPKGASLRGCFGLLVRRFEFRFTYNIYLNRSIQIFILFILLKLFRK